MCQKGLKLAFVWPQKAVFQRNFSLPELGGIPPPPPLTENHSAQKSLAELGGTPPPLCGKNPQKRQCS